MKQAAFLTGRKVRLRGILKTDLPFIARWLNDPDVTRLMIMGHKPTTPELLEEQWLEEQKSPCVSTFVILPDDVDSPVGWCGLYGIRPIVRAAEFRVFIGERSCWNKGFATDAARRLIRYGFETLNLNKVFLGVNASYDAAIRAYEKAGFVREGVLRQEIFRNNRYYDAVRMSILRSEYEKGVKSCEQQR